MADRASRRLTHWEARSIVADRDDVTIAAILAIQPSIWEFEEAVAWAFGESGVIGELERQLDGAVARVYDILMREQELPEDIKCAVATLPDGMAEDPADDEPSNEFARYFGWRVAVMPPSSPDRRPGAKPHSHSMQPARPVWR